MALSPKSWVPIVMVGPSGISAGSPSSAGAEPLLEPLPDDDPLDESSPESSPQAPASKAKHATTAHSPLIFLVIVSPCLVWNSRLAGRRLDLEHGCIDHGVP